MERDWNPDEPEWMDRPQPVNPGLERDLQSLGALNRHFGGHALVRRFLERWWGKGGTSSAAEGPLRVLDLCTGYGDIPRMMIDWARSRGLDLRVDAVDVHPSTLDIARQQSNDYPEITFHQADAIAFEPRPGVSYDLVHSALSLHHFSEEDAITLLRRSRGFSARYTLFTDLERSHLARTAVWLVTTTFYRDPMIRHDARLSVRRAFSQKELCQLAERAGWRTFSYQRFLPVRHAIWAQ